VAQIAATADHEGMLSLDRPGAMLRQLGLDSVYLVLAMPMGVLTFTVVVTGWSLALGLLITLIGVPIAVATVYVSPWMEWHERRRAALMLGEPIRGVYKPPAAGRIVDRLKALFSDPSSCAAGRARHSYDAALGCRPIECCASRSATQVAVLAGAVERSASPSAPRQTVSVEPGPTQTWVCATTRVSRSAARPSMSKNRRGESPGGFDDRQSGVSSQPTPLSVGVGL
jgi:hypothetical protein